MKFWERTCLVILCGAVGLVVWKVVDTFLYVAREFLIYTLP